MLSVQYLLPPRARLFILRYIVLDAFLLDLLILLRVQQRFISNLSKNREHVDFLYEVDAVVLYLNSSMKFARAGFVVQSSTRTT